MASICSAWSVFDMLKTTFDKNDNWCYMEVKKAVNGSYEWKLPAVEASFQKGLFLYEPSIALMYTSPRSNVMALNHYCIRTEFDFGFQAPGGGFATLGLLADYMWKDNSYGFPEGFDWGTNARVGIKF